MAAPFAPIVRRVPSEHGSLVNGACADGRRFARHPNAAEIAQINKAGGRVEIDPTDKSVVKAWLTKPTADDSILDSVGRLHGLASFT